MSAMEDADKALKNTQGNIEAVEKAAAGLGAALEAAFAKGIDSAPLIASIKDAGTAVDGLIANIQDLGPVTAAAAKAASEELDTVAVAATRTAGVVRDLQMDVSRVGTYAASRSTFSELNNSASSARGTIGGLINDVRNVGPQTITSTQDAMVGINDLAYDVEQAVAKIKAALGSLDATAVGGLDKTVQLVAELAATAVEATAAMEKLGAAVKATSESSLGLGESLAGGFAGLAGEIETAAANIRAAVAEISATRLIIPVSAEVVASTSPVAAEAGANAKAQAAETSAAWGEVNASIASVVATLGETNTALTGLVAAMSAGAKKVVEGQTAATAAVEKTKAAIKSTGAAAVEEAATEVAAVEEVKTSRKELIAILEQSRLAYSMEEKASFEGARARLARDNQRRSIADIRQGGGPTPNRFAGLPVRAGNTESSFFIGAQEQFYAQRSAMQAAAVEAEAYARVLGLVGKDSEDAALAQRLLNRAVSAAGPYASDTARQMAGLLTVTQAWAEVEAEAGARAQSDAFKVASLRTELVGLKGVAASLAPIVPTVSVAAAEAKLAELRAKLAEEYAAHPYLYGMGGRPPPVRMDIADEYRANLAAANAPQFNPRHVLARETPGYHYQQEIASLEAELGKATSGVGSTAPVGAALDEAKARIAEIEREIQGLTPAVTRLYRGESPTRVTGVPDWMADQQGRAFTSDQSIAERYARERQGSVKYVDVPSASLPGLAHQGGAGGPEYMLPRAIADQARELEALQAQEGAAAEAADTLSKSLQAQVQAWETVRAQQSSLSESLVGVENRVTHLRGEITLLAAGSQEWKNAVYLLNQAQTEQLAKLTEIDAATSRYAAQQRVANAIASDAPPILTRTGQAVESLTRADEALTSALANAEAAVAKNVSSLELLAREARAAEIVAAELKGELDLGAAAADYAAMKQGELARALQNTSVAALSADENLAAVAAAARASVNVSSEGYQANLLRQQALLKEAQAQRAALEKQPGFNKNSLPYMAAVTAESDAVRAIQQAINGYQEINIDQLKKIKSLDDIIVLVEEKREQAARALMSDEQKRIAQAQKQLQVMEEQIAAAARLKAELTAQHGGIPVIGSLPADQQLILSQGVEATERRAALEATAARSWAVEAKAAEEAGAAAKAQLAPLEKSEQLVRLLAAGYEEEVALAKENLAIALQTVDAYNAQGTATERLVAQQKLSEAQAAYHTALVNAGHAPHEAKAAVAGGGDRTPIVRANKTQLVNPFNKKAAEEIDAFATSTRGAAGSFFDLGTAAAFASSAFLVGLFGGTALRKVVEAARNLQTAQALLGNAVRNVGGDWDVQREAVAKYIEKVATLSGFTDTDLTTSMTKLVVATGNVKQSELDLSIATDLARAKNLELSTAVKDVVLVSQGHASILRRQGIELPVVSSAMATLRERIAKASDAGVHFTAASKLQATTLAKSRDAAATAALDMIILRGSVAGADAAYSKSSQGGIAEFQVALERLEVSIGQAIIPSLNGIVRSLAHVLEGWQKSGSAANVAAGGMKTFIQAVQVVKPIVVDLFNAIRDGITAMGGLKRELEILAFFWVSKFLVIGHPVAAIIILLDQLAQHIAALKGILGPLVGFIGTVFLAWKIGFLDAIAKLVIFGGAMEQTGDFKFTSMTVKILAGLKAIGFEIDATTGKLVRMGATAAEAGTTAEVAALGGGAAAAGGGAAAAAKGVVGRVAQYTAPAVVGGGTLAASKSAAGIGGLAKGEEALVPAERAALSGMAAFIPVLGPLTILLGGAAVAFLILGSRMSAADKAAKDAVRAFKAEGDAVRSIPAERVTRDDAVSNLKDAKSALAQTTYGTIQYRDALDKLHAAQQEVTNAQDALNKSLADVKQARKDEISDLQKLQDSLSNPALHDHGIGHFIEKFKESVAILKGGGNAPDPFQTWQTSLEKLAASLRADDPLFAHKIDLIHQLDEAIGRVATPHEIQIILDDSTILTKLRDLIPNLPSELGPDIIAAGTNLGELLSASLAKAFGTGLSGVFGGGLPSPGNAGAVADPTPTFLRKGKPSEFKEVPGEIARAISHTGKVEAKTPSAANLALEKAAVQAAIDYIEGGNFTKASQALADDTETGYINLLKSLSAPDPTLTVKDTSGTGKLTGLAKQIGPNAANRYEAAKAAAASAGAVQAGVYDPKVLEAQVKLHRTLVSTMALLRAEQHKVGATTKEGVAIQKELVTFARESTASLKNIEKEKAFKEAAAVHKKIDAVLGIGQPNQGGATVARARREEHTTLLGVLKHAGGKAGLARYGPGVESLTNKQLEALIKHTITVPKSTLTSLGKIDKSINLAASKGQKLTAEENANVVQRLKEINSTLTTNKYQSNYVAASAHDIATRLGGTVAERKRAERLIAQSEAHGGKRPTAGAAAGVPLPGPYQAPQGAGAAPVKTVATRSGQVTGTGLVGAAGAKPATKPASKSGHSSAGHAGGDVYIATVNINGQQVLSVKALQAELLKAAKHNGRQTKGANAGWGTS